MNDDFLTTNDLARLMHVTRQTVYRWCRLGLINYFIPHGTKRRLFRKEDVRRFLYREPGYVCIAQAGERDVKDFLRDNAPNRKR